MYEMYEWSESDGHNKVVRDSLQAIDKNKNNMSAEQIRKAKTEMSTGLGPDAFSQLCDRKSSNNFQG